MVLAQVAYLHRTLPGVNIATASLCLLFGALGWWWGWQDALAPWLVLGAISVGSRLIVQFRYRLVAGRTLPDAAARAFLRLTTLAAIAGGLMMGWGWMSVIAGDALEHREIFLVAQFAMTVWSLHAFRPYLPAFLGFVLASMVPAVAVMTGLFGAHAAAPGATLSLLLLTLVLAGIGIRFAREFQAALRLQHRVQHLLEEVTANRDEAVKATQAKSRFLASVSHDLRQPLHAMNLYLTALAGHFERLRASPADGASTRAVQDGIRSLQDSTHYLNSMFESLLDISRLNAGNVAAEIRFTTLTGMLAQLESDYSRQAASQGLRFDMRLPSQIPLLEVETDPVLLERLLRNLLVNAFRYTRAGGVRLSVRLQGRGVDFRVVDTGPGIAGAMRTRVFEEFFQVPDAQPQADQSPISPPGGHGVPAHADADRRGAYVGGRGIGLGLSIAGRLAETLGARIRLCSHVGRGSVFAIRQPVRIALRPQGEARIPSRAGPVKLPEGLFVAVIDDDPEIRRATRQMLEVLGIEVFTAESGAEAVGRLGRLGRMPDVLVSDYRLTHETGIQCIAMLREEFNHDIPALLITGDTSPERLEEFRLLGLTVLHKPIAASALVAAISDELRRSRPS